DLEVMMSDHDLDTAVTEGSLVVIRERYSIPAEYDLHVPRGGYYLTTRVGFRVNGAPSSNKGWKSHYLDWSAHPIGNAPPLLSEEETVFVDRLKGILSSSHAIKEMAELWLVEAGLSSASRDRMDLGELRGMPRVTSGKVPPTRPTAREVGASLAREALRASSKRPVVSPPEQAEDTGRHHKKVKVLTRKHKFRLREGESRSRSKGKEPATPSEEPEAPVGSKEGGASLVHECLRSMKDLFKTKVHKGNAGYYALLMSDLGYQDPEKEMKARWKGLKNSTKTQHFQMTLFDRVHDAGWLIKFMDYRVKQLHEELDVLKSRGGPEAVTEAEKCASELREEREKIKREKAQELLRREALEKELQAIRGHLGDAQQLLKEAQTRARRMHDDLLQAVKDLESARAELPKQSIAQYKESLGFKEGLKRMDRVTYEYGYRVALARFRARHPDTDVEEDPFTIHPEDDLVPMKRQQDFDDSVPPEP
ncbi:hypothetical protein B296_00053365, partial [Ensete ventricosum]